MGLPPIRTLDDIRKLGEHVRERGFTAQDQHLFVRRWESGTLHARLRSLARGPELNPSVRVEEALDKQLAGFRDGTGKSCGRSSG
jgi:galactonate dehydratase